MAALSAPAAAFLQKHLSGGFMLPEEFCFRAVRACVIILKVCWRDSL